MIPLRDVKQRATKKHSDTEPWVDRWMVRKISIHLTWLLVHTPLTANEVTLVSMALIAAGVVCMGLKAGVAPAIGAALMLLGCVFDSCDGEIARFRRATSLRGVYLDTLAHAITIPGMYLAAGIGQFLRHQTIESLVLGAVASIAATHPAKISLTVLRKGRQPGAAEDASLPASRRGAKSLYLKTFGRIAIFPNSMYVMSVAAVVDGAWQQDVQRGAIFWAVAFYAALLGFEQIIAAAAWSSEERLKHEVS